MKSRFTIKELEMKSDDWIVRRLIGERMSGLNPNAPLYMRLKRLHNQYDQKVQSEGVNS